MLRPHLNSCPVIGFDTEFIGEETYVPDLCLIQVATPERLILIDPLACGPLDAFWRRIADPERMVVARRPRGNPLVSFRLRQAAGQPDRHSNCRGAPGLWLSAGIRRLDSRGDRPASPRERL